MKLNNYRIWMMFKIVVKIGEWMKGVDNVFKKLKEVVVED